MSGNPYYQPYWNQNELEHHGIKGQSWGEKNGPPYPLDRGKDGRVTQTQKKKKQGLISRIKANKKKKARNAQLAKAREAKAKKAEETKTKEQLREELLKSTDPKFISKHLDLLDTREINDRLSRIDTENRMKKLATDMTTKKKVDKGMEWINTISKIAEASAKSANAYTAVYNAAQQKGKSRQQQEQNKEAKEKAKRIEAENKKTSKEMQDIIKMYTSGVNNLGDIKVDFDPTTGKLSFQTMNKKN